MKKKSLVVAAVLALLALPTFAEEAEMPAPGTPASIVAAYDALADTILSVRDAEMGFVAAMLDGHMHAAKVLMKQGSAEGAAAQMALFANEGDNNIGGVRKRLLEGGHHHNADGEAKGLYEPGYVVVTRAAKMQALDLAKAMRQAGTDEERQKTWKAFETVAMPLIAGK